MSDITRWGIFPTLGILTQVLLLGLGSVADAAYTEPRLALTRVAAVHSSAGSTSLQLEGTFSLPDVTQLALPVSVYVLQGTLTARFDQAGHVYTSVGGGSEQLVAGLGLVSLRANSMVVVLPAGFTAGTAMVRVVITYDGQDVSSNQLGVTL